MTFLPFTDIHLHCHVLNRIEWWEFEYGISTNFWCVINIEMQWQVALCKVYVMMCIVYAWWEKRIFANVARANLQDVHNIRYFLKVLRQSLLLVFRLYLIHQQIYGFCRFPFGSCIDLRSFGCILSKVRMECSVFVWASAFRQKWSGFFFLWN